MIIMSEQKIVFVKGKVLYESKNTASIYVYADHGGRELSKYVGKEVKGLIVVEDP